jgi:HSP20 family protein
MKEEDVTWVPPTDFYETAGEYVLCAEIPGVELEDIRLEFSGRTLTIRGERRFDTCCEDENYQRLEGQRGRFLRRFELPEAADTERARMRLADGLVHLVLPKTGVRGPRGEKRR